MSTCAEHWKTQLYWLYFIPFTCCNRQLLLLLENGIDNLARPSREHRQQRIAQLPRLASYEQVRWVGKRTPCVPSQQPCSQTPESSATAPSENLTL